MGRAQRPARTGRLFDPFHADAPKLEHCLKARASFGVLPSIQSWRRAIIGSTRMARRAGI
jgi:hypothetical protein